MVVPKSKVAVVRVGRPLAPFADGYRSRLAAAGYSPLTSVNLLRQVADRSRWLEANGLGACDVTTERMHEFLRARRGGGDGKNCSFPGLELMAAELHENSVISVGIVVEVAVSSSELLLGSFSRFLLAERGLAACTAESYVARARRFLAGINGNVTTVTGRDVIEAVRAEAAVVSVGATQLFVVALRAFLRFLAVEGVLTQDLSPVVLSVVGRRHSFLPQGISTSDAQLLLAACDRDTSEGRRDRAVILLLLRLGLRASEAAQLCLDDIDWHSGEIIHGKRDRDDRLPLPVDVGEAIVDYLRNDRPNTTFREVFLRAVAPTGPLERGGISSLVRHAAARAQIAPIGAHRLRHSTACDMVAAGVPLPQIGQVLRHQSLNSTAIYARVDLETLRTVALPWPSVVSSGVSS